MVHDVFGILRVMSKSLCCLGLYSCVIWTPYNCMVNKFCNFYMRAAVSIVSRHDLRIEGHYIVRNQPTKTKLAPLSENNCT